MRLGSCEVLVGAAADLAVVREQLTERFQQLTGCRAKFVLGSSGLLAQQIRHGAPYDVFLSADSQYVSQLAGAEWLVPDSVATYAYGRLGLWSKTRIAWAELTGERVRRIAMANPAHAPYGMAARQALQRAGLWAKIEGKVVYGENVRQALQFAESGNAEVAVTAWGLIFNNHGVLVDQHLHAPIEQSAGLTRQGNEKPASRRFLQFLMGAEGQGILAKNGFGPVARRVKPGGR